MSSSDQDSIPSRDDFSKETDEAKYLYSVRLIVTKYAHILHKHRKIWMNNLLYDCMHSAI